MILLLLLACDALNDDRDPCDGCASMPVGVDPCEGCVASPIGVPLWLDIGYCMLLDEGGDFYLWEIGGGIEYSDTWDLEGPTGQDECEDALLQEDIPGGWMFTIWDDEHTILPAAEDGECAASDLGPWIIIAMDEWVSVGPCPEAIPDYVEAG
jgi:hypothetical protein